MPVFEYQFTVDATLEQVRAFHRDTNALRLLTPPPTLVQMHSIEPLANGSTSKFTLWVGPLPLRWTAVHRDVTENGFTDVQTIGPAKKWEHTHRFTSLSKTKTQVNEYIEYEHRSGFWGIVTRVLFAKPNLYFMFTYRKIQTRQHVSHA